MTTEAPILDVVEKLYSAALDGGHWTVPLDAMSDLFGAVSASFEFIELQTKLPTFLEVGTELLGVTPTKEYLEYYGTISPRVAHSQGKPTGFVSYDHMILSDTEMDRNEYYSDCMEPVGLRYFVACQVFCSESHQGVFAVHRSPKQGHVDEDQIEIMRRLTPHLQQASDLKFRLSVERAEEKTGLGSLDKLDECCLVIDQAGNILHLNSKAHLLLARGDGIATNRGQLRLADRTAMRRYRFAISQLNADDADATARDFPARRPSGDRPYLISLRSLPRDSELMSFEGGAAAILFIRDPEDFTRLNTLLLRESYDLSEAEAALAAALDMGKAVQDVAHDRGVSIATARSQLYSLMAKLGVNRQPDLIRLMSQYRRPFS